MESRDDYDGLLRARRIPLKEPRFEIRAQDAAAFETVQFWAGRCLALGAPIAAVEQGLQQGDRMAAWPIKKVVDADHIRDPAVLEAAFNGRIWAVEASAERSALDLAFARGRSTGVVAGARSVERTFEGYRAQIAELRREVATLTEQLAAARAAAASVSS